jgi:hypothetical protein
VETSISQLPPCFQSPPESSFLSVTERKWKESRSAVFLYLHAVVFSWSNEIIRVDNIKMDLREMCWGGMDWIGLAQDRDQLRALVNTVMNLRVP